MGEPVKYAKVDGPPDNWAELRVFDLDTGEEVQGVIEVDAASGWLIRYKRGADGNFVLEGDAVARERVTGRYEIRPAA